MPSFSACDDRQGHRLRILQSVRGPSRTTNPYVVQLVNALRLEAEVSYFSWRRGIFGRYDVLHVHWPEVMVRRTGIVARSVAQFRFTLLLFRLTILRTHVVRTLHNVQSHEEGTRIERLLLAWLDRYVSHRILLTAHTPTDASWRTSVIRHGDYVGWFQNAQPRPVEHGRLLYFGLIRPYKGVDDLLRAFAGVRTPGAHLAVVGKPSDDALSASVQAAVDNDARISARLEYIDDESLADEVNRAQLVVLPYRSMLNSGALLLALSLRRPVLAPSAPTTLDLAEEVGRDWLMTYEGPLRASALESALASAHSLRGEPDLSRRAWSSIAEQHLQVYAELVGGGSNAHART